MPLEVQKTTETVEKMPVTMLVYGNGGVGKTTLATTAPNPLLVDCEGGTKYLGKRGIEADVVNIKSWSEMKEVLTIMKDYDTIVIDPIGELMEKLKRHMIGLRDKKLTQNDGSPTAAGWGWLKDNLRSYLKVLRDSGKHVLIIAHVEEKEDGDHMVKRPLLQTKLSEEIVNMLDAVGYMTRVSGGQDEEGNELEAKRVILVDADSDRYVAKDRSDQLNNVIEPDFSKIVKAVQGTEVFAWSSDEAKARFNAKETEEKKEAKAKKSTKKADKKEEEPKEGNEAANETK